MSEFTAIGPALDIDGPLPVAPRYRLLDIPGVLRDAGRELNGVNVDGYPSEVPTPWEPCSSGTFRTKGEGEPPPTARFDPVGLYVPITCSAFGVTNGNWRDFAGRAERVLEATLSYGVELVLSQGVVGSANPFLGDTAVTALNGGAATAAANALAFLEQAIGATGRRGLIHAPNQVASIWRDHLVEVDGHLETIANGTPVAVGGGYDGATANGAAAGAGNAWAFATGPVRAYVGEATLVGEDINGTLDTSTNDLTFRAERYVLAEWDTALQAAILVDWTP